MKINDTASFSKTITESAIVAFAGLTDDFNLVHVNDVAATGSVFKSRIAHGMLSASFISTVLGTKIPGEGTIYLSQNLKHIKTVYTEYTVTVICIIKEVMTSKKVICSIKPCIWTEACVA